MDWRWSPTQEENPHTIDISGWNNERILAHGLDEIDLIKKAISKEIHGCEKASELITQAIKAGGRVITVGAGGSGVAGMSVIREIPQNHRELSPDVFLYKIAGDKRVFGPIGCEELEDDYQLGSTDMIKMSVNEKDVVILISATGRTPYTLGAAASAKKLGAQTIGIVCQKSELLQEVSLPIFLEVGPEMFVGATCEKAATAQKHVLDMIMNVVVVRLGVVAGNIGKARLVHGKARLRDAFFSKYVV